MALWGNKDDKTSAGTVNVWANGQVVGTSTFFADPAVAKVGDYITIDASGQNLRITEITSNTIVTVVPGTAGESVTNVSAGGAFALSEKPVYVSMYTVGTGVGEGAANVYGVSIAEQAANVDAGIQHAGWVRRMVSAGAGGIGTRVRYETLVAMSGINGDALDDSVLMDFFAAITTQPSSTTANLIANAALQPTFTVVNSVRPENGNVAYYWQVSTNSGATWANISNATAYGTFTDAGAGKTTTTLLVKQPVGKNTYEYRVKIWGGDGSTGFSEITSSNVILTVIGP
ncbi:MAG: hypothetical protein EBX24_07030 [Actinobacteria bacterium]|nr:hypothetical protein [Actinomycetota bacterium]